MRSYSVKENPIWSADGEILRYKQTDIVLLSIVDIYTSLFVFQFIYLSKVNCLHVCLFGSQTPLIFKIYQSLNLSIFVIPVIWKSNLSGVFSWLCYLDRVILVGLYVVIFRDLVDMTIRKILQNP